MNLRMFLFLLLAFPAFSGTVVNDVTRINPIEVRQVIRPSTTLEIVEAVKAHSGPISIGGGRYSMGGQTATPQALQIDMRGFNKILKLDVENKKITVQAGISWRDIQEVIDKKDLSIKIMQTYSNFTVGGSLSVNAHGRYVGEGPLVRSVDAIKIVLADGREVTASLTENPEIFLSAIGGYGGIGVITEATLNLVPNEKIRRTFKDMNTRQYREFFQKNIRGNKEAVFHNGDLYPPAFREIKAETWFRTDKPVTIKERLIPKDQTYWLEPDVISSISTIPYGNQIRQKVLEPLLLNKEVVSWRNREASYDVAQLEPTTPRLLFTYVLQEYFIPVDKFESFVPKMRAVFQKNKVNIVNVSIRHALPDSGTYLAWAPEEVFSFVVYYKQSTSASAQKEVGVWTRDMINQVLAVGGRYYLPYQIHATEKQFRAAYPGYDKFFAVKKKVDPTNKFRNRLWDRYYAAK